MRVIIFLGSESTVPIIITLPSTTYPSLASEPEESDIRSMLRCVFSGTPESPSIPIGVLGVMSAFWSRSLHITTIFKGGMVELRRMLRASLKGISGRKLDGLTLGLVVLTGVADLAAGFLVCVLTDAPEALESPAKA